MFKLNKYLTRLILFSIGISTLPVIISGLIIYFKTTSIIQEKVNEGNVQVLEQTRLRVEQVLFTIDRQITQLVNSYIFGQVLSENVSPKNFQMLQDLTRAMYRVQTFDVGVQDVHLVNLGKSWVLNNNGFTLLSELDKQERISQYLNVEETTFWTSERESLSESNNQFTKNRIISFIKKIPVYSLNPTGMFIVEIPSHELGNFLSKTNKLGQVLILDEAYRILVSQDEQLPFSTKSMEVLVEDLKSKNQSSGVYTSTLDGSQYGIVFQKSSFNQWVYLSVIPLDEVRRESRSTGWIVLISCIAVLLLAVFVSLKGSQQIYLPIHRLYESVFMNQGQGKERKVDELHLINERFQRIQSTHLQMTDQSNQHIRQLEELYVMKIIQGEMKPMDIQDKLTLMSYDTSSWQWVAVIAIQIDSLQGTRFEERDTELLLFAIGNIVGEIISSSRRLLPIIIRSSLVTLVHGDMKTMEEFRSMINTYAKQIQTHVESYLSLHISIGLSRPYKEISDSNKAYREALKVLKYRLFLEKKTILGIEDIQPEEIVASQYPEELEMQILDEIKRADLTKINELLDAFFKEISSHNTNYNEYQIAVVRLFIKLARIMQETGIARQELLGNEIPYLEQLYALKTGDEIRQWLMTRMIEPMVLLFQEHKRTRYQDITSEVVQMIHDQYDSDISLESCSSCLNYHPSYISRILKRELGISFSEYLMQYRLKMAKVMLSETDMKIKDIAEKLMYKNPQNFIRYFRKMEGITPGEYRNEK